MMGHKLRVEKLILTNSSNSKTLRDSDCDIALGTHQIPVHPVRKLVAPSFKSHEIC